MNSCNFATLHWILGVIKINILAPLLWIIGIVLSLIAIFKIVGYVKLAVGLIIISFGILSVIWTSIANRSLSKGSELRRFTEKFLLCSTLVLLFSIWSILDELFHWKGFMDYFGYILLTVTFFMFVFAAYHIQEMGKQFGFEVQAKSIKKIMARKKSQSK